jgi:murein DD-endopeptidase MepM/ murein hydrolase activator NlpD
MIRLGRFLLIGTALFLAPLSLELGAEDRVHVVARGETVYSIARSYGITQEELMRYNGITDPQKLIAGKRLNIPGPSGAGPALPSAEYRALRGDTLYSIARRHGITLQSLLAANGLDIRYVLKEGDRLRIPSSPAPAERVELGPLSPALASLSPRLTERGNLDPSLRWPVAAKELSYMTGKLYGVVLLGERSDPVRSLMGGTVVYASPYRGFGRVAIVEVTGGYTYVYGGCESLSVKEGDRVAPGTEIGRLGLDTVSEKPQLFFMVYRSTTPIDPAKAPRA